MPFSTKKFSDFAAKDTNTLLFSSYFVGYQDTGSVKSEVRVPIRDLVNNNYNISQTILASDSGRWDKASTSYIANSAKFVSTYNTVFALSAGWGGLNTLNWDSTYTTVLANSASWKNTFTTVNSTSGNWDSVHSNVNANSGDWDNTYLTVNNNNQNWSDTYTAVKAFSGDSYSSFTTVKNNSAFWSNAYTNLVSNSAAYLSGTDLSFLSVSANWNSVYSNVNANSATWGSSTGADTAVRSLTSNWENTYSTVRASSASWSSGAGTLLQNLSTNWQNTYTTVSANSASWTQDLNSVLQVGNTSPLAMSVGSLTADNIQSVNNLTVGTGSAVLYINGTSVGVKTEEPTEALTVAGNVSAQGYYYGDGSLLTGISPGDTNATNLVRSSSANWTNTYTVVRAGSAQWVNSSTTVRGNSGNWTNVYNTVQGASGDWGYTGSDLKSVSANWENTYNTVYGTSGNWQNTYSSVYANSANWNAAAASAGADVAVRALTGNWQSTYSAVQSNSATWGATNNTKYDSVYSNVNANSANWMGITDIRSLSSNWQDATTLFREQSAGNLQVQSVVGSQSGDWNDTHTIVYAYSAAWGGVFNIGKYDSVFSNVNALSADWENTKLVVTPNSANWQAGYDNAVFSIQGTTNQIDVSQTITSPGSNEYTLSFPNSAIFPGDVYITNNLTVGGSAAYINTANLVVNDSLIYLAQGNVGNTLDIGFVAHFTQSPLGYQHTGLARRSGQSNPGVWTLFSGLTTEPLTGNNLDWADKNITLDTLSANIATRNGTSDQWNSVYSNVNTNSAAWASNIDTGVRAITGAWQNTYSSVYANSANWNAAASSAGADVAVRALTGNWQNTYTTVNTNSATLWNYQGNDVKALSGNWQNTYSSVYANSANWNAAAASAGADVAVRALTGNWQNTYSSVYANSANWTQNLNSVLQAGNISLLSMSINNLSANDIKTTGVITTTNGNSNQWNSVYSNVNTNSANWNAAASSAGTDVAVRALTGNWQNTYSSVYANSANWTQNLNSVLQAGNISLLSMSINNLSANDIKTTGVITTTNGNSNQWNSVYSNVNSNSANYILKDGNTYGSDVTIGTNDNFNLNLETNNVSKVTITTDGKVGIGTPTPNEKLTVIGNISATGVYVGDGLNIQGATTEVKATPSITANTLTLDLASGALFYVTLNASINTLTLQNVPASPKVYSFTLQLIADSTARTVAWPISFRWSGGTAPTITSTLNKVDTFTFLTHDGGTNWFAFTSNQNQ